MVTVVLSYVFSAVALLAAGLNGSVGTASRRLPGKLAGDHRSLTETVTFQEMVGFLQSIERPGRVDVSEEGKSVQGRGIFVIHLSRGGSRATWRVFFYAQQHGNEVSGKDALLFLVRDIVRRPELLPEDVDLWVMPMVNPDGAELDRRVNANGADLNRDHLLLAQPETQAVHRVARRVLPHIAVDCHEFTRDSEDYRKRGWWRWPIIMMDGANHPLFDPEVTRAGWRFVSEAEGTMARAGHAYEHYNVGGIAPEQEQRYSTLEANDGRNGIATYGGLSFIIEAGVKRSSAHPSADLGERIDAYLALLRPFLTDRRFRSRDIQAVDAARARRLPPFLPTNCFWANAGPRLSVVRVVESATLKVIEIPTANFMQDAIVKRSVSTPYGYAIDANAAPVFRPLLERHGIEFETLVTARTVRAEHCSLVRIENDEDPIYERYGGRQIVERQPASFADLPAGSLVVRLDQPARVRAALVLEPTMLYGLYQHAEFRRLVMADGRIPVLRIVDRD